MGLHIGCKCKCQHNLVPHADLEELWEAIASDEDPYQQIAREFKVSVVVAARRALDLNLIDQAAYLDFYENYLADERRKKENSPGGGDFWNNQNVRLGRRFSAAIARAVKEGRLLYREAYALTGLNGRTFERFLQSKPAAPKRDEHPPCLPELFGRPCTV